eukprot:5306673-Amphidinium_carterae.1
MRSCSTRAWKDRWRGTSTQMAVQPIRAVTGWSVVAVNQHGNLFQVCFGLVPWSAAPLQQARNGKDYPVDRLAELAPPPFQVRVDCMGTINARRLIGSCHDEGKDVRAHLWSRWRGLGCAVEIQKVKAHQNVNKLGGEVSIRDA